MDDEAEAEEEGDIDRKGGKNINKSKNAGGDPTTTEETPAQEKRRLKKNLLAGFDVHAANLAAAKAANEAVPIPRYEEEEESGVV